MLLRLAAMSQDRGHTRAVSAINEKAYGLRHTRILSPALNANPVFASAL